MKNWRKFITVFSAQQPLAGQSHRTVGVTYRRVSVQL